MQNPLEHFRSQLWAAEFDDSQLLERYLNHGEPMALEVLIRRHGPMIAALCRRWTRDESAAEDAYQATFLVFLQRAQAIRKRSSVAAWLHGVAWRIVRRAQQRDRRFCTMPNVQLEQTAVPADSSEVPRVLDEELARLPARYREVATLCLLEGLPRRAAARRLGLPEGTVASRLTEVKRRLARRLQLRGLAVVAGAATLLDGQATAIVPAAWEAHLLPLLRTVPLKVPARLLPLTAAVAPEALRPTWLLLGLALLGGTLLTIGAGMPLSHTVPQRVVHRMHAPATPMHQDRHGDPLPPGALARIGTLRFSTGDTVERIWSSPDSKTLVTASGNYFDWWDASGRPLRQERITNGSVQDVAFLPDGRAWAAVFDHGGNYHLWEFSDPAKPLPPMAPHPAEGRAVSLEELKRLSAPEENCHQLCFALDGSRLFGFCQKEKGWVIRSWQPRPGIALAKLQVLDEVELPKSP